MRLLFFFVCYLLSSAADDELSECMCSTEWSVPEEIGCEEIQYGCPDIACDDKNEPRWCLLAENPCKSSTEYPLYLDDDYMECGDDSPIFGNEDSKIIILN